jgi:glycosyltransferase involved in cell wall biosynthesis
VTAPVAAPVAIVIPCYKQAHLLGEALSSSLAQVPPPAEIIVVDDGSPDDVAGAVAAMGEAPSIRLVRRPNGGLSAARNTGLEVSRSPFLVFLDADDRLCPGALAAGLACLAEHTHAAFVHGGYRNMDLAGTYWPGATLPRPGPTTLLDLLAGNVVGMHGTALYRREPLEAIGGFDEALRSCEDWDVYLRLAKTHEVVAHRHVCADYRRHAGGMSQDFDRLIDAGLTVLERHRPAADDPPARHRSWRRGRVQVTGLNLKRAVVAGLRALGRGEMAESIAALRTVARYLPILSTLGADGFGPKLTAPARRSWAALPTPDQSARAGEPEGRT